MGTTSYTEILTDLNIATEDAVETLVSQVNEDNFLSYRWLKRSKPVDGGKKIGVPLLYDTKESVTMSEYEEYDIQPNQELEYAYYDWKHINDPISLSLMQMSVQNTGKRELVNLAATKMEACSLRLKRKFSTLMYLPVASLTSKDPDSLVKIVATTANTVGGIDASTHTATTGDFNWTPFVLDYTSEAPTYTDLVTPGGDYYIENIIRKMVSQLTYDADRPTVIMVTQGLWDSYEQSLRVDKRWEGNVMEADGGFTVAKFRNVLIAADNRVPGGKLNTGSDNTAMMLVLNERYLGYRHSPAVNFKWTPWYKMESRPVFAAMIDWIGAVVCSRRDRQGAVTGLPTDAQIYV